MRPMEIEPDVYFGAPGKLVKLPWPKGGMNAAVDVPTFDFVSGSGNHRVSRLASTSRAYQLNWNALHQSTFDTVNEHYLGLNGPGPWVLVDPSRPNLLSANQAAATGQTNDATGFQAGSHQGSLSSVATPLFRERGLRSLRWSFSDLALVPSAVLSLDWPGRVSGNIAWKGFPVVAGQSYAYAFRAYFDSGSMPITASLLWVDAAGATVSESTQAATVTAGWTGFSVLASAPVGAVYVIPRVLSAPFLNANYDFETNVANWTPTGETAVQDGTQFKVGTKSMKVTPDGVTAAPVVVADRVPVVAGKTYRAQSWLYSALGHTGAGVQVNWYNAALALISTSTDSFTIPATTWTQRSNVFTAPANAVWASLTVIQTGTPPATHVLWIDYATLTAESGGIYLDAFQLEMAPALYDWAPGSWMSPVAITGWDEDVPFDATFRLGPALSLREVL